MKTQVFKNSESVKSSNLLMLISMIIFCEILLFTVKNEQSFSGNGFSISQVKKEDENLEFKMRLTENKVSRTNESIEKPAIQTAISMAKMREYLINEKEPELIVEDVNSIVFPDFKTGESAETKYTSNTDHFLMDLKHQSNEKTREAVEYYAMEKKVKEFLTLETEKPLCLEEWMVNRKCWCPELNNTMALTAVK